MIIPLHQIGKVTGNCKLRAFTASFGAYSPRANRPDLAEGDNGVKKCAEGDEGHKGGRGITRWKKGRVVFSRPLG